ncbi:MAG: hypothetical protein JW860_04495 [Sedimentisphaerales bacterium]|nr:hypothetical protein [Sedimentisphaerales bacterium]
MLILRIKQAECALADGRLEEAYNLARIEDFREHRKGQEIIGRLARTLAQRGLTHLDQGRLPEALADCTKAETLAGNLPVVVELRNAITEQSHNKRQLQQQEALKLDQARKHINNGWLSTGEKMLQSRAGNGGAADLLLEQAAAWRLEIETTIHKARESLERNDLQSAIKLVLNTGPARDQNKELARLFTHIKKLAITEIRDKLQQGRVDQARMLLNIAQPLVNETLELQELERSIRHINRICRDIETGRAHEARQRLRQLKTVLPEAHWLDEALQQAEQAAHSLEALRSGPLGLAGLGHSDDMEDSHDSFNNNNLSDKKVVRDNKRHMNNFEAGMNNKGLHLNTSELPDTFVIQIDGAGSYLVLRDAKVTVGPISSSRKPQVGLVAEPNLPVVAIERTDGDYFLRSQQAIQINDKIISEKLLAGGDTIMLSERCRLKFQVPNAASTTAKLSFNGARHPRLDIREAILLDRELVVGPGSSAHIRTERAECKLVLMMQEGRLVCKTKEYIKINGQNQDKNTALPMETPVQIGDISLVLTRI